MFGESAKPFFTNTGTENRIGWTQWFSYRRYTRRVFLALDEMFPSGSSVVRENIETAYDAVTIGFKQRSSPEMVAIVIIIELFRRGVGWLPEPPVRLARIQFLEWIDHGAVQTGDISPLIAKLFLCIGAVERWFNADLIKADDKAYFYAETWRILNPEGAN